jgi:DNA replication protein DnaC
MNTKEVCWQLRLLGIHEGLSVRLAQAASEGMTHEEFLLKVLEDERLYRKNRAAKMLETKANFRRGGVLEEWDTSFERGVSKGKLRELGTLAFHQDRKTLVLVGGTGCGKTHLAIAIGRMACQHQLSVRFLSVQSFLEEIPAKRAAGQFLTWIRTLARQDILIFDDIGLRPYTHEEGIVLLNLLEERYQKGSQIFTSQVEVEGWKVLFEDPILGDAITNRVRFPSERLQISGASYRERLGGPSPIGPVIPSSLCN